MSSETHLVKEAQIKVQIGLDIATKRTGFAAFANKELISFGTIETNPDMAYSGHKVVEDIKIIDRNMLGFVGRLRKKLDEQFDISKDETYALDVIILMESSNHANKALGQKLATYIGLYSSSLVGSLTVGFPKIKIELKLINPREWQLRAFGEVLDRQDGKSKSIDRALEYVNRDYKDVLTDEDKVIDDDTADAINIASLGEVLRDNLLVGQEKRERVNQKIKNKNQILNIQIKINKLLNTLREKQTKQINRALNTKNGQDKAKKLKDIPLICFATKNETERILRYENELKELEADIAIINKFKIVGEDN